MISNHMKRKQFNQLRQLIKEEIKLAIKEQEAIKITPEQKKEFLRLVKRTMGELYLNTGKEVVNDGEVDRLLVSVLTNDETDWLEDIDQYGYDPDAVKKYAEELVLLRFPDPLPPPPKDYENIIQQYIQNGNKGDLDLMGYDKPTLPNNFPSEIGGNLYLNDSSIKSLPDGLTVHGNLGLSKSSIKSLPNRLTVHGTLSLAGLPINSLPKDLVVKQRKRNRLADTIWLTNTPISKKYTKEELEALSPGIKGLQWLAGVWNEEDIKGHNLKRKPDGTFYR